MNIIKEKISATLVIDEHATALRMNSSEIGGEIFLSYALTTQGPGHQVLPSVLLDDWGNEVGNLGLYRWIRENGLRFPRAEIFGLDPAGSEVQYFLRDLELMAKFPAYVFEDEGASATVGTLIKACLIPEETTIAPQRVEPPEEVGFPLREADVQWWRVSPNHTDLGFLVSA